MDVVGLAAFAKVIVPVPDICVHEPLPTDGIAFKLADVLHVLIS
jgi:hypothetical protein